MFAFIAMFFASLGKWLSSLDNLADAANNYSSWVKEESHDFRTSEEAERQRKRIIRAKEIADDLAAAGITNP